MDRPQHIVKAYDDELAHISARIIEMGGLVEKQLADAIQSVVQRDAQLAEATDQGDAEVDRMEGEIDELTIKLLARRQPMADDLRELVSALRIVGILERIGDYAAHVAGRADAVIKGPAVAPLLVVSRMGKMVRDLLADALGAYAQRDPDLAISVWRRDQDLDQLHASLFVDLLNYMQEDADNVTICVHLMSVAKYIERIGDLSTNIAEHVHYIVRGAKPAGERPKVGGPA